MPLPFFPVCRTPFTGVEGAAREFVEENTGEPLVKESPPVSLSDDEQAVFSPAIEVVEADGNGMVRNEHVYRSFRRIIGTVSHYRLLLAMTGGLKLSTTVRDCQSSMMGTSFCLSHPHHYCSTFEYTQMDCSPQDLSQAGHPRFCYGVIPHRFLLPPPTPIPFFLSEKLNPYLPSI